MNDQMILVSCMSLFLILSVICSAVMIVNMMKKGDERVDFILSKTCTCTVKIYVGFLVVAFVYHTFLENRVNFFIESSPILYVGMLAIVFSMTLWFNNKKYGAGYEE